MNRNIVMEVSGFIRYLNDNILNDEFEKAVLQGLSSLFKPSYIAFAYEQKTIRENEIPLFELSEGNYTEGVVSVEDFSGKHGFSIYDTETENTSIVERLSTDINRKVISYLTRNYHCIVLMTDIKDTTYLSEENLFFINSTVELLLNARFSIKDILVKKESEINSIVMARHRMKTCLSAIHTAIELLMSPELSEEDERELKRLAYKGVNELTDLIDAVGKTLPEK